MATPNTGRPHRVEDWRTSVVEGSFDLSSSVEDSLTGIAAINHEAASGPSLEGGTANTACKILDGITTGLHGDTDNLQKVINISKDAPVGDIQAKHESIQTQSNLAKINDAHIGKIARRGKGAGPQGTSGVVTRLEVQRGTVHAEVEKRAVKALSTLNGGTLMTIGGFSSRNQIWVTLGRGSPKSVEWLTRHMSSCRQVEPSNASPRAGSAPTCSVTD